MALGDGTTWDETTPVDASYAYQIDDYNRDVRKGVRSRMALEHEFPASQATTGEGGRHKFITLQNQTAAPTLYATQYGAVYVRTTGRQLCYVNSTGAVALVTGTDVGPAPYNTTGGLVCLNGSGFIPKAFALISSTAALISAFNVTSVTYAATGIYYTVFNPAMSDTKYLAFGFCDAEDYFVSVYGTKTTTRCGFVVYRNGGAASAQQLQVIIYGT